MRFSRRLTAFASGLLVALVPLLLGGGGAAACAAPMTSPGAQEASMAMADMEMPGTPSDHGHPMSHDGGGCPGSGMTSDACRTMGACVPAVVIASTVAMRAQPSIATGSLAATVLAPASPTVSPEPPPPRA